MELIAEDKFTQLKKYDQKKKKITVGEAIIKIGILNNLTFM